LYLKAKESGNLLDKESLKDTSVYRLAELAGLFGAEQKEASSASPDTNNKDIKLVQSTPNTSDAKPVITNVPKSTYEALPPLPKETNFLYTNKPATKNTDGENRTTPTPDLGKDTNTNPVPSNGGNIESSPPKVALNSLKLEFYTCDKRKSTQGISLELKITNTGSNTINLKDLKVRYYFTDEGDSDAIYSSHFYSNGEKEDVHGEFVSASSKGTNEYYLELTFDKGTLLPNKEVYVIGSITKEDWGYFNQENDYSFGSESDTFAVWDKITAYISDVLVWGKEPD
ncbi:MAG: cellulose binding domain-containing protein, partial [Bacillota bacterium]|nr:cellulose binding domain-containing protein [Bacillota bacterium]